VRYSLHPEAEWDLREAAGYYKDRAGTALSQAFFTEFEYTIELLLQHPLLGALWLQGKRRRLVMRHFPFSVIYTVSGEEIRVWAVAHQSRRPGYWRDRKQ
jgi:plasmid stabilization system protein ParE